MIVKVKVVPNSKEEKITRLLDGQYKVNLNQKPENNKANIELIKLLKKYFKSNVKIIKGLSSRNKIVKIEEDAN